MSSDRRSGLDGVSSNAYSVELLFSNSPALDTDTLASRVRAFCPAADASDAGGKPPVLFSHKDHLVPIDIEPLGAAVRSKRRTLRRPGHQYPLRVWGYRILDRRFWRFLPSSIPLGCAIYRWRFDWVYCAYQLPSSPHSDHVDGQYVASVGRAQGAANGECWRFRRFALLRKYVGFGCCVLPCIGLSDAHRWPIRLRADCSPDQPHRWILGSPDSPFCFIGIGSNSV